MSIVACRPSNQWGRSRLLRKEGAAHRIQPEESPGLYWWAGEHRIHAELDRRFRLAALYGVLAIKVQAIALFPTKRIEELTRPHSLVTASKSTQ